MLSLSVSLGAVVCIRSGVYRQIPTVHCCLCLVIRCLLLMNWLSVLVDMYRNVFPLTVIQQDLLQVMVL